VPLQSGEKDLRYSNYPPSGHVEGKAAIWIGDHGSTGGVVYHNNTDGICGFCNSQVKTLSPLKKKLLVVPPTDAVAKKRGATAYPTPHVGDDAIPRPPKQYDFFLNWP
jgi:SCP1.201-like deaminase